jgi:biopolymer transport protein ExbB/TolQ
MTQRASYRDDALHRHDVDSGSDKWLFTSLFIAGSCGILAAKIFTANPFLPIAAGVGVMLIYGLLVRQTVRFRVREDRAGDSAYYLGFLFTLVSLSYALWEFSHAGQHIERVIGHFAVALATTIVGLVMRVWFQQLREDPVEVEPELRASLAHASETLKSEVLIAVESVSVWRTKVLHELSEEVSHAMREQVRRTDEALTQTLENYRAVVKETAVEIAKERQASLAQQVIYRKAEERILASLDAIAERIDAADLPTDALERSYRRMTTGVDRLAVVSMELSEGVSKSLTPAMKAIADIEAMAGGLGRHLGHIHDATGGLAAQVTATEAAVESLVDAIERSVASTASIAKREQENATAMNAALEIQLRSIERTNDALDTAVTQSRKSMTQMHEELAGAARIIQREIRASRS